MIQHNNNRPLLVCLDLLPDPAPRSANPLHDPRRNGHNPGPHVRARVHRRRVPAARGVRGLHQHLRAQRLRRGLSHVRYLHV